MSADNYLQVQKVEVLTADGNHDEWWCWDLCMSSDYIRYGNEYYTVVPVVEEDHTKADFLLFRCPYATFYDEESLNNYIGSFAIIEYGVSSLEDIQIYRSTL